ncbi:MAG: phosphate/phosphite/phosphonate ABC transporter substrate-binding protein [Myxococcales bacterium]|nr:phosphate/phosphite/phosphonate ABC transporter substrate-binding protein [Myxococcales bacterium]
MTRIALGLLCACLLAASTVGCDEKSNQTQPLSHPKPVHRRLEPLKNPPAKLIFGMAPTMDPKIMRQTYAPIIKYLSQQVGIQSELRIAASYQQLTDWLGSGHLHVVQMPPLSYVRAKLLYPKLRPLVRQVHDGSDSYIGYLVARKSSGLRSLSQLRGKRLGLIDPNSASGFLMPMLLFEDRGIEPRSYFSSLRFLGNHTRAIRAVLDGRVDVAAVDSLSMTTAYAAGIDPDQIQILAKTHRIPFDIWCTTRLVEPALARRIRGAFIELSTRTNEGRRVLSSNLKINGFIRARDSHYEGIRRALRLLKKIRIDDIPREKGGPESVTPKTGAPQSRPTSKPVIPVPRKPVVVLPKG